MKNGYDSCHVEIVKRLMMLTYICYSFCSWGMHLCYKSYTSSYRVVSICPEQEKHMHVYNLGIYIATWTWYQYTKCMFAYLS